LKHIITQFARARLLRGGAFLFIAAMLGGCGVSQPVLSLVPVQSQQTYLEKFTQAYITRNAAGDYEVVLVDDPMDESEAGEAGQPLAPSSSASLRQVVRIRLLWRPVPGAKADSPAATNASLHWYVLGGATAEGTSMIHYAGTAFVAVATNGPGAAVTIHNGSLKFVERHGDLVDPLKAFKIDGKFDAVEGDARLAEILADVKTAVGEARNDRAARAAKPDARNPKSE
jgi:hypothetical protein